jgi:hypothetical protein
VVDETPECIATVESGDLVLVRFGADAKVLRQFVAPDLLVGDRLAVSELKPTIVGVVVSRTRDRGADMSAGKRWFCSEGEAMAAGWRPVGAR